MEHQPIINCNVVLNYNCKSKDSKKKLRSIKVEAMRKKNINNNDYYTTAVSIGDLKNGLLYFDNIIPVTLPLDFAVDYAKEFIDSSTHEALAEVVNVIPKNFRSNKEFMQNLYNINISSHTLMSKMLIKKFNFPQEIKGITPMQFETIEEDFANEYLTFIHKYNFGNYPLIANGFSKLASLPDNEETPTPAILTISNLKLIDATSCSWEQLLEFRKDEEAKVKLRKLRLFAYNNYTGKSKNFIEDDIHTRIYEYDSAAKKFGLDLIQASLNHVVNSKLFTGVAMSSILTALFAENSIGMITATAGAIIELGQFTLEYK